jgi:hypothetical protein
LKKIPVVVSAAVRVIKKVEEEIDKRIKGSKGIVAQEEDEII